jgi:hypothetical protein
MIAGILSVAVLAALAFLFSFFSSTPTVPAAGESLVGIRIGDSYSATVDHLKLTHGPIQPWRTGQDSPAFLKIVPAPADLGISGDDLERVEARWAPDDSVAVMGLDDSVVAVVVRKNHRGATGRGAAIGSNVGDVYRLYDDDAAAHTDGVALSDEDGGGHGEVRRYAALGLAFVIQKSHVRSIALYPPKAQP